MVLIRDTECQKIKSIIDSYFSDISMNIRSGLNKDLMIFWLRQRSTFNPYISFRVGDDWANLTIMSGYGGVLRMLRINKNRTIEDLARLVLKLFIEIYQ